MFYCVYTNIVGITKLAVGVEVQMAQQRVQQPETMRDKKRQSELEKGNEGQNEVVPGYCWDLKSLRTAKSWELDFLSPLQKASLQTTSCITTQETQATLYPAYIINLHLPLGC